MKRLMMAAACAAVLTLVLPVSAPAFTLARPVEATQNAYGLWYAPEGACAATDCHASITSTITVHSEMVKDISANPSALIPAADSGEWPPPSGGGVSIMPSDIFLQVGDAEGMLEYVGVNRPGLKPFDDLSLWSPMEYHTGKGWAANAATVTAASYGQSCSTCHNLGTTRPSYATYALPNGGTQTTTTPTGAISLSIGCEVCHGSGENPSAHATGVPEVVGGVQVLKAQVCGQCHVSGTTPQKNISNKAFGNPNGYTVDETLTAYLTPYTAVPTESQFMSYITSGTGSKPQFLPNGADYSMRHTYYNEWLINKKPSEFGGEHGHADPLNNDVVAKDDPKCLGCHSGIGFLNRIGAEYPTGAKIVTDTPTVAEAVATDVAISCQICHTGHVGITADGYDSLRKWADGHEVSCDDCHTWQFDVMGQETQTETVGAVTTARPALDTEISHPEAQMVAGGASGGMWGVAPVDQQMVGVECKDCHMPRTHKEGMPADDDGTPEMTRMSHRFHIVEPGEAERWKLRPQGDSCATNCHELEAQDYSRAQMQQWIDDRRSEVGSAMADVDASLDPIATSMGLVDWTGLIAPKPAGADATAAEWTMLQRAAQNLQFVQEDGSIGIHNPVYAMAGLAKAATWASAFRPQLEIEQAAYPSSAGVALDCTVIGHSGESLAGLPVTLERSAAADGPFVPVKTVSARTGTFSVSSGPISSGENYFRLTVSPSAGVTYTTSATQVNLPETSVVVDPASAITDWVGVNPTVTLSTRPGAISFVALTGAQVAAPAAYTGPITVTAEGITTVSYWSVDAGGAELVRSVAVRVDKSAPIASTDTLPLYTEAATVTVGGTDAYSAVCKVSYSLDGTLPVEVDAASAEVAVKALGAHTIVYRACDALGHWSSESTATFSVKSKPTVYKSPTGSSYTLRRGARWKYSATLKRADGTPAAGAKVRLQRSTNNRTWSTYATLTTGSTGSTSRTLAFSSTGVTYWRWYVVSDAKYLPNVGKVTKITVR